MTEEQKKTFAKFNEYGPACTVGQLVELLKELPNDMRITETALLRVVTVNDRGPFLSIDFEW